MLAMLASFLAAVTLIPAAEATGLKASSHADRTGTYNTPTKSSYTHTKRVSKVKCSAVATSSSYADAADGFAYATADAFAYLCSRNLKDDYRKVVDIMYDYDSAWAFAYARATADVECESQGNAYGCASARANAKAWAKAVLRVYAHAWAAAINKSCSCRKNSNEAVVDAYGSAYEFERLVAKVEAEADARVCVAGDDEAMASAESECYHSIYATGFAKAFAKAVVENECYRPYGGDREAEAKIKAVAKIDRWDYIYC